MRRAPSLVFLLDGRPHARLDGPFTEDELQLGREALAAAPREGPWPFLGTNVPLGLGRTLDGEIADPDALSRSLLLALFNPDCPPCWDALPGRTALSENILPVVVVLARTRCLPTAWSGCVRRGSWLCTTTNGIWYGRSRSAPPRRA